MRIVSIAALIVEFLLIFVAVEHAVAKTIVIGSKDFTEQRLIAELTNQLLTDNGLETELRTGLSSPGLRTEQEAGLVDLYWEYTGTSLSIFNSTPGSFGPEEGYARVRTLDAKKGLIWLAPSKVDNTYALAMRREDATRLGLSTISDLASSSRRDIRFRIAVNTEFFIRADGLQPLQRAYRFEFALADIVRTSADEIYDRLRTDRSINVGLVFSTDGRIPAYNFVLLSDDRSFFPAYILAPVIRSDTLESHPEIANYLKLLSVRLDNSVISALNARIDVEKMSISEVASTFLRDNGLLGKNQEGK